MMVSSSSIAKYSLWLKGDTLGENAGRRENLPSGVARRMVASPDDMMAIDSR